jgi:hypothetical protein
MLSTMSPVNNVPCQQRPLSTTSTVIAVNNVNDVKKPPSPPPAGVSSLVATPPSGVGFLDMVDVIDSGLC